MNLEPAPRLPKWIFFAIDAGLLTTAFIIIFFNDKNPYAPIPLICAVVCVLLAAACAVAPFIADYESDKAEFMQKERARADEYVQRLHVAGESLARAAAQIKAVEEAVHKSAHTAENLPYRMQEKLAEFNEALAAKDTEEREVLERELDELRAANSDQLKVAADKIAKATGEWTTIEVAARKQVASAQDAAARLHDQFKATLAEVDSRIAALAKAAAAPAATIAAPPEEPAPIAPTPLAA